MLSEFDTRVLLENAIRAEVRMIKNKKVSSRSIDIIEGKISALQEVLEYDNFTIQCIERQIERQEGIIR